MRYGPCGRAGLRQEHDELCTLCWPKFRGLLQLCGFHDVVSDGLKGQTWHCTLAGHLP